MTEGPAHGGGVTPGTTHVGDVRVTPVSPVFKLVFVVIVGLTVLALAANVCMALMVEGPNQQTIDVMNTCSTFAKTGFGAIVGLIGGKLVG